MKTLASIGIVLIGLTGCSARHYAVCMAVGADAGCSHVRFSKQTAAEVGALMAGQPGSEERSVWILDMRKHAKDVQRAPQPAEKPEEEKPSDGDHKI